MSLSSYCRNCGAAAITTAELSANHCDKCEEARKAAMQNFVEQNPEGFLESDRLYAGRQALMQRVHSAHAQKISPRDFNRADMERR